MPRAACINSRQRVGLGFSRFAFFSGFRISRRERQTVCQAVRRQSNPEQSLEKRSHAFAASSVARPCSLRLSCVYANGCITDRAGPACSGSGMSWGKRSGAVDEDNSPLVLLRSVDVSRQARRRDELIISPNDNQAHDYRQPRKHLPLPWTAPL